MIETQRPHLTRKHHQQVLDRQRRMRRKVRRARVRRIRGLRLIRTARFWIRTGVGLLLALLFLFWAKFAIVYDIPEAVRVGQLADVTEYVTIKPWWFGPPSFDLGQIIETSDELGINPDAYSLLLHALGQYQAVVTAPRWVWVNRVGP